MEPLETQDFMLVLLKIYQTCHKIQHVLPQREARKPWLPVSMERNDCHPLIKRPLMAELLDWNDIYFNKRRVWLWDEPIPGIHFSFFKAAESNKYVSFLTESTGQHHSQRTWNYKGTEPAAPSCSANTYQENSEVHHISFLTSMAFQFSAELLLSMSHEIWSTKKQFPLLVLTGLLV